MNPLVKVFIGLVLLVIPLALYAYDLITPGPAFKIVVLGKTLELSLWKSLWIVVQGTVLPFVALIGLFIVWLELDEWRIEKELRQEEEKEKEMRPRGRPKKKK